MLSAFKLKYEHLFKPAFASPVDKDLMLKSAKVFRVWVCKKESEARKSSELCNMLYNHD